MEENCGVYFGSRLIGKVQVTRQGLYYRFQCRCHMMNETVCRLNVVCADKQENLGILVPMGGGFGLDTKLPVKRLGEGKMEFQVIPKHPSDGETIVPIYPEEPFAYISRLRDAYLVKKDGQAGLLLK